MGKKVRYQYLKGSLLKPILRYTLKLDIGINPISDPKGAGMARYWYQLGSKSDPRFKQPNLETYIKNDYKTISSYMTVEFINGLKHGFYFKHSTEPEINMIYEQINDLIEFERTLQGHDDEYEDEVA